VGGARTPLKKYEFVNGKDDIPFIKWKKCLKPTRKCTKIDTYNMAQTCHIRSKIPNCFWKII
jgi:hypothetical protein